MRSATAIATLCSLLSFVLTAPAPSHTRTLSIQAVNIKDEVYLASSPSQMTICSQDGKGTMLGWVYGYASSTIGEERVRWILVTLGTSVPSCDSQTSYPVIQSSVLEPVPELAKRDTNTNNNTNNVNINTGDTGNSEDKGQGGGLSTEAKIGIGVGVPSAVFTLIGLFIMCAKRG